MEPQPPTQGKKPFRQWGIGFGSTFLLGIIAFFINSGTVNLILFMLLLLWAVFEAFRGRFYILLGVISAPFVLFFVFLIICGGLMLLGGFS